MGSMRTQKKLLKEKLSGPGWKEHLPEITALGMDAVPALFSFLLQNPLMCQRSARALGETVAKIYEENPEAAKNIIRRYMWHMNEDSGNIGWGIPQAFAETLAASPPLAKEYGHILVSYVMDLGHADNYCDLAQLRRSCFWAVGRLAQAQPGLVEKYRQWLVKGLSDEDDQCRGAAAWALGQLPSSFMELPQITKLANEPNPDMCEIYENDQLIKKTVAKIATDTLNKWTKNAG